MRKITLFLVLALCLSMMGCSKDAEIKAFISELDTVTNEMVQKINAGDVDGARTAFDGKKESLKTKWDGVKTARGFQVSKEVQKEAVEKVTKNASTLAGAMTSNMMKLATDKAKLDKLQALVKEYTEVFR
ncbi:MAG: hypothetical protein K1X72_09210 [Pyrinomonadaceae bacterium]|nr:hypothetical protein [Pyrinomonadaceae bacterium]